MRISVMPGNVSEAIAAAEAVAGETRRRVGEAGCSLFAQRRYRLPAAATFLDSRYVPPLTRSSKEWCGVRALDPKGHPHWQRDTDGYLHFLPHALGDHRRLFWWPAGRRPGLVAGEPYGMDEKLLAEFVDAYGPGSTYNMAIFLDGDSPHFPGRTLLIEVWAQPVWDAVHAVLPPAPDLFWLDRWVEAWNG